MICGLVINDDMKTPPRVYDVDILVLLRQFQAELRGLLPDLLELIHAEPVDTPPVDLLAQMPVIGTVHILGVEIEC